MTRLCKLGACCLALGLLSAPGAHAQPDGTLPFDIAPQPLVQALTAFAQQTGLQLIYVSELVSDRLSKGAPAGMTTAEALARLLDGTGLRFQFLNARTVRLLLPEAARRPDRAGPPVRAVAQINARADGRLLQADDVIVTATRREEELSKVAISVAAWTQSAMEQSGVKRLADIAALTPGVEFDFFSDLGPWTTTNIAVRGVNSRNGTSTGIYLDDTPIRSDPGGSFGRPLPLTFDLERVEVLRGPQGTLLGESAEGGAIRFITKAPSLTTQSGQASAEFGTTARGDPSYVVGAAAGGPLVKDRMGFRVSGWYESSGGYVDRVDPFTGAMVEKNVNRSESTSVRAALAFAAGDSVTISPSVIYQSLQAHDSPAFYQALSDPGAGILRSGKLLAQPVNDRFALASVKVTAALGGTDLTAVSSYFRRTAFSMADATNNPVGWGNPLGPEYPVSHDNALPSVTNLEHFVLSQELRLESAEPHARYTWSAGLLLLHARYWDDNNLGPAMKAGTVVPGYQVNIDGRETQVNSYAQATMNVTARTAVTAGLRVGHSEYDATRVLGDAIVAHATETPLAPKVGVSFQADDHNLYYATVSTGYRIGGVNTPIQYWCQSVPKTFGPDSVASYEIGAKNTVYDGRILLDSSAFYMRWRNIQSDLPVPTCFSYTTNLGAARSAGFDLSAQAILSDRLKVGLAVGYTDARYAQSIVSGNKVFIVKGDVIGSVPVVPSPWNVTTSIDYGFNLSGATTGTLRAEDVFHSCNPGPFYSQNPASVSYDPTKRPDPSNNLLNLRAAVRWSNFDAALSVDNVFDSQSMLLRRNVYAKSTFFLATTFRPRTVALALNWRY